MGVLKVKVGETWESILTSSTGGGGVADVLHVGPEAPTDPSIELWADTDETPATPASGGGYPLVALQPFSTTGWTWVNQGAATVAETARSVFLTCPSVASENVRALVTALPAGTPTITVGLIPVHWQVNFCMTGVALRESATGKLVSFQIENGASVRCVSGRKNTNPTTIASGIGGTPFIALPPAIWFLRVQITATQYVLTWSANGVDFTPFITENKNAFFTTGPDQIGLMLQNFNSGTNIYTSYVHWSES